jgi:hypothetical protein
MYLRQGSQAPRFAGFASFFHLRSKALALFETFAFDVAMIARINKSSFEIANIVALLKVSRKRKNPVAEMANDISKQHPDIVNRLNKLDSINSTQ